MTKIFGFLLLVALAFSSFARDFKCASPASSSLYLQLITDKKPLIWSVDWKNLYYFNQSQNKTPMVSSVAYSSKWNHISLSPASGDFDSFHMRVSKYQYKRIRANSGSFKALVFTTNSRGHVWVKPKKFTCIESK